MTPRMWFWLKLKALCRTRFSCNGFKQKTPFYHREAELKGGVSRLELTSGRSCRRGTFEINVILLNSTQLLCVVSQNELNHKAPKAKAKVLR